ncbi:DMT family transporter [Primorskyibacter flagellatus]|uniref:Permease of the drug/metabolite transporter (DMT) superfamily n=1 Tax=Primorskyibacter flagellatus TaxID=1387277 RepID=A0A1W2AHB4_9RHOB|nr:DMT family transporter [Primorskyibacter flagellatus]SMC60004.1 Permease of the drug/metabolite transporter (DMT) superfamily [Primorskyibacter flagellatus]
MNLKGLLYALFAFAVYATHDVVIKYLGATYSPFQIIFFSTLMSFPLVSFMLIGDQTHGNLRPVHPWWIALRTVCTVITGMSAFYAFSVLPLAQTYAILFASPLLITLMSIPLLGEKVGLHRGAAVIVGLAGVFIVLRPGTTELTLGHLAGLSAAMFSALASIIVRKIGREERSVVLMLYPMAANFIVMAVLLAFVYQPMPLLHLGGIGVISLFGFVAGLCLIAAYKNAEAAIVAPMQYSQIIWATLFGYLLFGESVDRATIIGTSVIIISGLYIVFRESRGGKSENTPVLRTRSRGATAATFRITHMLRRAKQRG